MKKWIAILLALALSLSLFAGCGAEEETRRKKDKDKDTEPETIVGTWEYDGDIDCAYIFADDGTGAYRYSGVDMPFTYTDDGKQVSILFEGNTAPNVLAYSIRGKTLTIEDSFGDKVKYKWVSDAKGTGKPSDSTASYDWWEGAWYGWWAIKNGTGSYQKPSELNLCWDAYAEIEVYNDNTGLLRLWDTGTSRDTILVYGYDITFREGVSLSGCLVSSRVEFFPEGEWNMGMEADPMSERDIGWTVDPGDSTVSHFGDMLEITGHYASPENPDDSFDYYIYLRPWGAKWEDVRNGDTSGCLYSDMMPIYYDSWYLPLLEKGYTAPPVSFEEGVRILETTTEAPSGEALDPAGKEGADGIVPLQTLKDNLQWCKSETDYDTTYDEVAAKLGAHGKLTGDDGDYRYYRWLADDDNYIQITFSVKDGQEYWNVTQWNGLK